MPSTDTATRRPAAPVRPVCGPAPEPHMVCVRTGDQHWRPNGSWGGHLWMDPDSAALYRLDTTEGTT